MTRKFSLLAALVPLALAVATPGAARAQASDSAAAPADSAAGRPHRKHHQDAAAAVRYRTGRGLTIVGDSAELRIRIAVQPMLRFSTNSNLPDAHGEWIIRRTRLDLDASLPHALQLRFAVQAKNMRWGLSNIYGVWSPNDRSELAVGYLKPPGGLERDAASFDEPFIERSVVAFLTYDKEVGARFRRSFLDDRAEWTVAVSRPAPPGTDGGDPEDLPKAPTTGGTGTAAGVDPEDLLNGAGNFDVASRLLAAPSDAFATGVTLGVRTRPDGDLGDRLAEPYDTQIYGARAYKGTNMHLGADMAWAGQHARLMAEGGFRQDGQAADSGASGHLRAALGYVTFGVTPNGRYGAARDNAPLRDGWEVITRVEGARLTPPTGTGLATTWWSVTTGLHWELSRALRVQSDVAFEHFDPHAEGTDNVGARRMYFQLWSTIRL